MSVAEEPEPIPTDSPIIMDKAEEKLNIPGFGRASIADKISSTFNRALNKYLTEDGKSLVRALLIH